MNSIEINGINKSFNGKSVLNEVTVHLREGEVFGLLGPSGAGKTTLIKIVTGQLKQDGGKATILGEDSCTLSNETYTRLGMVLDNAGLYERLSCYANLALFAEIYRLPKKKITEMLQKVGLGEAVKLPVHKLSKGMKQRLVLARALMHEPGILFLDEPTSGLDPTTAVSIHELILEQSKKGTTIFLTTHNMEEASKLCENVALLYEGKIVEYGNPKEVCRKYNHQNKIEMLLKDGNIVALPNDVSAAEQIGTYIRENKVETIHSTEPNLETVFMELTGRRLEA